jgi:alanine racemase
MTTNHASNTVDAAMRATRATRATIDLAALRHNVAVLAEQAGTLQLWAVVKANAYGHGAVQCAQAALAAGAHGLCVALTQEAVELRTAGIDAPIMVLSEQPVSDAPILVAHRVVCVAYNEHYIAALASAALASAAATQAERTLVHLKIDTGMHRVGVTPAAAVARAQMIANSKHLVLDGVMTHLATADDPAHSATMQQVAAFNDAVRDIRAVAPDLQHVHVANSAATLRALGLDCTLVRAGIALYGLQPGAGVASLVAGLQPVMALRSRVLHVQRLAAGQGVSYGLRSVLDRDSTIATLPLGYADGIARRAWQTSARVLVGGRARRIVGVVTMDQMMVDCGDDAVAVGDEAVIFGTQSQQSITVDDWAAALDTISYEVVCAISPRVPRDFVGA